METQDITIINGNGAVLVVNGYYGEDGETDVSKLTPRPFEAGDIVYFTVKTSTGTKEVALQKVITEFEDGAASIKIKPSDTRNMPARKYVYDVQLTPRSKDTQTIIEPHVFVIKSRVTDDD